MVPLDTRTFFFPNTIPILGGVEPQVICPKLGNTRYGWLSLTKDIPIKKLPLILGEITKGIPQPIDVVIGIMTPSILTLV
jgi:hypothetical protein